MTARDIRNETGVSLGDLAGGFRRRMWWFLIPAGMGRMIASALAVMVPSEYEAVATVTVEPQVIPRDLAPSTIEAKTENRYENLKLQLLARDSLSAIITDFKLFEGSASSREDQVEALRRQISLDPL